MVYQYLEVFVSVFFTGIVSAINVHRTFCFHLLELSFSSVNWLIYLLSSLIIVVLFLLLFSKNNLKKRSRQTLVNDEITDTTYNPASIIERCNQNTVKAIISTSKAYFLCFEGFFNNDKQQLKNGISEAEEFNRRAKKLKDEVFIIIGELQQDQIETGHFYVQVVDYLREMAHSLNYALKPVLAHYEGKHRPFETEQATQFNEFRTDLNDFFNFSLYILKEKRFENLDELIDKRKMLVEKLKTLEKSQIKRIKNNSVSTRNSVLYFNIITETKTLLLNLINVVKAQRDFINETTV